MKSLPLRRLRPLLSLSLGLLFALPLGAADPTAAEIARASETGGPGGLAVQVGATDAAFLALLTANSTRLVHGLCLSDAVRDPLRSTLHRSGHHPLATVSTWTAGPRLPYADRLVNLLVLDRDALGPRAPDPEECRRVIVPGGVLMERRGGAWNVSQTERPAGLGNSSNTPMSRCSSAMTPPTVCPSGDGN